MEKRRKGVFGPSAGKEFIVYVDDLNMPKKVPFSIYCKCVCMQHLCSILLTLLFSKTLLKETYGAQPPIELLRQWFDQSGWYDRKALVFRRIIDTSFVSSMGPPGGGRNPISERIKRLFNRNPSTVVLASHS